MEGRAWLAGWLNAVSVLPHLAEESSYDVGGQHPCMMLQISLVLSRDARAADQTPSMCGSAVDASWGQTARGQYMRCRRECYIYVAAHVLLLHRRGRRAVHAGSGCRMIGGEVGMVTVCEFDRGVLKILYTAGTIVIGSPSECVVSNSYGDGAESTKAA